MNIKYIIDQPYEGKYTITDARDGSMNEINEISVRNLHKYYSHETFFSAKADVALRSVPQREIFPGTNDALNELAIEKTEREIYAYG